MIIYGLYGFTHGWGRLLTVMSPEGAAAATGRIVPGDQIEVSVGDGRLPQYHEKRQGALARMVERYGIVVLDKEAWDDKKQELGEQIW